jgi:hypothetical protein
VVVEVEAMAAAAAAAAMAEVATAAVVAADAATAANGADVSGPKENFRKRLGQPRRFFVELRAGSNRRQKVNPCQVDLGKT